MRKISVFLGRYVFYLGASRKCHGRTVLLWLFTMKYFLHFSPNHFSKNFLAFWRKKLRRHSLIIGVPQGLVEIRKKYVELNHFLLLICSTRTQGSIIVLIHNAKFSSVHLQYSLGVICLVGGNYFWGKLHGEVTIFQESIFLGGSCSGDNFSREELSGGKLVGGMFPLGLLEPSQMHLKRYNLV